MITITQKSVMISNYNYKSGFQVWLHTVWDVQVRTLHTHTHAHTNTHTYVCMHALLFSVSLQYRQTKFAVEWMQDFGTFHEALHN